MKSRVWFPIHDAPFKEYIQEIIQNPDKQNIRYFVEKRLEWNNFRPFLTHRVSTHSLYEDYSWELFRSLKTLNTKNLDTIVKITLELSTNCEEKVLAGYLVFLIGIIEWSRSKITKLPHHWIVDMHSRIKSIEDKTIIVTWKNLVRSLNVNDKYDIEYTDPNLLPRASQEELDEIKLQLIREGRFRPFKKND